MNRAYQDVNVNVGVECKEWIRTVIKEASGNHVIIPLNNPAPNDYYWQNDPYGNVVGMSIPIEYVQVGWIIQMRFSRGIPHTAIVVGNNGYGTTFIDSNFYYISAPTTVKTHFMTYQEFKDALESPGSYSVCYIL